MYDENFEYEICELIMERLKDKFKIKEDVVLYRYLCLRFLSQNIDKKINIRKNFKGEFINYLIDELNLSYINNKIYYKYTEIMKLNYSINCFENIIDNWLFRINLKQLENTEGIKIDTEDYILKQWEEIYLYAKRKNQRYIKDNYYKYHIMYSALDKLNQLYGIDKERIVDKKMQGFIYDFDHDDSPIIGEDMCCRYMQLSNLSSTNIKLISEKILEDFMIKNLEFIETGLICIRRQVRVSNGILDILAKDKYNNFVIIELKVEEDKDIVWQVKTYFKEIKELYKCKNVRVITLSPTYSEHMRNLLSEFDFVEMFEFTPYISNKKIDSIDIRKVS